MSLVNAEAAVQGRLECFGFAVTSIPELPELGVKTPDFYVNDHEVDYIVEVKDKHNQQFLQLLDDEISAGERTADLDYHNTVSGIIEEGVKQLDYYDTEDGRFKVLWFWLGGGLFDELIARRIQFTLYGLKELEGFTRGGQWFRTGCFYFTYNDFFRYPQLDAVIVQWSGGTELCLNEFSKGYDKLHSTRLCDKLEQKGAIVIDPPRLEKAGHCFTAVDCHVSRKNSEAVIYHIGDKYGLRQITVLNPFLFNLPLRD